MDEKRKKGKEKGKFSIDVNDIIGKRVGKLKVKSYIGHKYDITASGERVRHIYEVECDCGTIKEIRRSSLKNLHSKSCGCGRRKKYGY